MPNHMFTCSSCGNGLDVESLDMSYDSLGNIYFISRVDPCFACRNAAESEGWDEGFHRGKGEGYDEGREDRETVIIFEQSPGNA